MRGQEGVQLYATREAIASCGPYLLTCCLYNVHESRQVDEGAQHHAGTLLVIDVIHVGVMSF